MKKTACRPKVYLETSIPSYLASRPSNDLRVCANQNIANAIMRPRIEQACRDCGFEPPIICTPQELMEG